MKKFRNPLYLYGQTRLMVLVLRHRKGTLMSQGKTHMLPLNELHQQLIPRFRSQHITLELISHAVSVTSNTPAPTLTYMRPIQEARAVERLMGREGDTIDVRRHPLIEIRPLGTGFAMEMILTPDAWFYRAELHRQAVG